MTDDAGGTPGESPARSVAVDPGVLTGVCEAGSVGLVAYGPDSTVEWVDERVERYVGIDGDGVVGTDRATFLDSHVEPCLEGPTPLSEAVPPDRETPEAGAPWQVLAGENREQRWLRVHSQEITTGPLAGGRLDQFVDVTAEQATQRRERCEQVVDTSDAAVFVVDPDGTIEYANEPALDQSDDTLASMAGRRIEDLVAGRVTSDEDAERFARVLEGVLADETPTDGERSRASPTEAQESEGTTGEWQVDLATERGTRRYDCSSITVDGERKAVVRARDVSAQLRTERQYETLVNNFPNGAVTFVDDDLTYQLAGGELFEGLPEEPADIEGSAVSEIDAGDRDLFLESYREALAGHSFEAYTKIRDRVLVHRTGPVFDDDGSVRAAIGMTQDVTDRKERERELRATERRLNVALEETDTGVWVLEDDGETVQSFGRTQELLGLDRGTHAVADYMSNIHPEDAPAVQEKIQRAWEGGGRFDAEFRVSTERQQRWVHARGETADGEDTQRRMVGVTTDVTDRKRRERALEKRERILRELNTATRAFYPPESPSEIADFLVEFIENAFEFGYVGVKRFDETEGVLEPAARSLRFDEQDATLGPVSPGDNPIWETYRSGEAMLLDGPEARDLGADLDLAIDQALVAPIGDFGVTVALTAGESAFDDVDLDLIEVVAANAESAFKRLHSDRVSTEMTEKLSTQRAKVGELRRVIDAIQTIQRRLAESESREALETGVCEELLATDPVDFAWLGRPKASDTDLAPAAWADRGEGYLDSVATSGQEYLVPAQRAAAEREVYSVSKISERVLDEVWAKEALSVGFDAVLSIPIVYDGILYGVLTAYSQSENAFGEMYETLFSDVASLVVSYSRILEHRYGDSQREYTELEFELTDVTYPLQRLAAETDARLRFETVVETTGETVRSLVTVEDGSVEAVLERAESVASIVDAARFGDTEHRQISLTITKPFLASEVTKHGGELLELTSDEECTTLRVALPRNVSQRPLIASLTARYAEIDLLAQRQTTSPETGDAASVTDRLTDRQSEILTAAYHGGYYESPRKVTGEDLAESFDISSPAVYNHLQAAHRSLLERIFEPDVDVTD